MNWDVDMIIIDTELSTQEEIVAATEMWRSIKGLPQSVTISVVQKVVSLEGDVVFQLEN